MNNRTTTVLRTFCNCTFVTLLLLQFCLPTTCLPPRRYPSPAHRAAAPATPLPPPLLAAPAVAVLYAALRFISRMPTRCCCTACLLNTAAARLPPTRAAATLATRRHPSRCLLPRLLHTARLPYARLRLPFFFASSPHRQQTRKQRACQQHLYSLRFVDNLAAATR